ncbi:MAG: hypothetical protein AAGG75_25190, partial [Bacteroidota bacterium]
MSTDLPTEPLRLTFDSNAFFAGMRNFCISAIDGDFGSALGAALKGLKDTLSTDGSPGYRAQLLLHSALAATVKDVLTKELLHRRMLEVLVPLSVREEAYSKKLLEYLKKVELSIDADFISNPRQHHFTSELRRQLEQWLQLYLRYNHAQAKTLAAAFPYHFTRHLAQEWSGNEALYEPIRQYFDNPFFTALKKQEQMLAYQAKLLGLYARPAFGEEGLSLHEMYMRPEFRVYKGCIKEKIKKEQFYESQHSFRSTL